jgi:hypothetical protein
LAHHELDIAACSTLAVLAQRLASLAPALTAAVAATPWLSPALTQVEAACLAVDACAWLGARLGLQSSDALRLAAGASLVFSAGRVALLVAADAVWRQPTSDSTQALNILVREQLAGLSGTFRFPESDAQPDAAAAFAASTAAPRVFLPWIAAASDALLLAYPSGAVRWNTACPLVCCWAAPL